MSVLSTPSTANPHVPMHLLVYGDGDAAQVEISLPREVDVRNRQAIKYGVIDWLAKDCRAFVIDFSGCGYIDTSGLGVLLSIRNKIAGAGGTLVLRGMNAELRDFMRICELETLFTFTD